MQFNVQVIHPERTTSVFLQIAADCALWTKKNLQLQLTGTIVLCLPIEYVGGVEVAESQS